MGINKKASTHDRKQKNSRSSTDINKEASRHAVIGAPAQPTQSSRKGKRAWRKNVDIAAVEEGLEELREEERLIGGPLHTKTDEQLFTVDVTGDERVRRQIKTKKPLTSTLILAQRSAVPAVSSRASHARKEDRLTREEKERLLRIGKRKRSGPFNAATDTTEIGKGSALLEPSEAVKQSGTYDIWMEDAENSGRNEDIPITKAPVPKPRTKPLREMIAVSAVSTPHQGTSYNPPVDAYQNLLSTAVEAEKKRLEEEGKYDSIKSKIHAAVASGAEEAIEGMVIDIPGDDDEQEEENGDLKENIAVPAHPTRRKTQQQRRKALRIAREQRALKEKATQKKLLASVDRLKALRKDVEMAKTEQERITAQRKLEKAEKLRKGLVGIRIGKHKVTEGDVDVQLGDDLSESLRGLKVEGNLFKDRLLSMQNRALVEPRSRVLPTRRRIKVQELEKFAWKRFT